MTTHDGASADGASEASVDVSAGEIIGMLMTIQGQRASCYNDFEKGFRTFLSDQQEQTYMQLVQSSTAKFSTLSSQVNVLEAQLKSKDREDLAVGIRGIQQAEKVKLEMTATLHVLRRAKAAKERSGASSEDSGEEAAPGGHQAHAGAHSASPAHQHACCSCGPPPPEPTDAELAAAISEATQNVEAAVSEINDLLEELRYEME